MTFPKTALAASAIILGLMASTYFLVIRPAAQKRDMVQHDTEEKTAATRQLNRDAGRINVAETQSMDVIRALSAFNDKLPAENQMGKVVEEIWHLAEANSLQTQSIKEPTMRRIANLVEQDMELSVAGDFSGFYQFLLKVEEMKRVIHIKKMTLAAVIDRDGDVQADLTLSVYLKPTLASGGKLQ